MKNIGSPRGRTDHFNTRTEKNEKMPSAVTAVTVLLFQIQVCILAEACLVMPRNVHKIPKLNPEHEEGCNIWYGVRQKWFLILPLEKSYNAN